MKPSTLHPDLPSSTRPRTPFPNVRCNLGHPDAPGYTVCRHIVEGKREAAMLAYKAPSAEQLGMLCCSDGPRTHAIADWALECAACAIMRGHLPDAAVMMMKGTRTAPEVEPDGL